MPNYVHSIPNNNDNQDIVSMGTNSALIARTVVMRTAMQVMAIHFMAIVQAVDCLAAADRLAPASREIYDQIRAFFPAFRDDTPKYRDIARTVDYLMRKNIEL